MLKIGHQGKEGSNTEEATVRILQRLELKDCELIPLVSSGKVIEMLKKNKIDYGVVAVRNSVGGIVEETYDAVKTEYTEFVTSEFIHIHHCMFVKNPNTKIEHIKKVASHPQALTQCQDNIKKYLGNVELMQIADTATGAVYLKDGRLRDDTAVICRKNTGEKFGLHLLLENIEDTKDNKTEFRLLRNNRNDNIKIKWNYLERIKTVFSSDKSISIISKTMVLLSIFITLYFQMYYNLYGFINVTIIASIMSIIFLIVTSNNLKNWLKYRNIIGFWMYYSMEEEEISTVSKKETALPKIVKIEIVNGELSFSGWICTTDNIQLFRSHKVFVSSLVKKAGNLIYWFNNSSEKSKELNVNGIVTLNWNKTGTAGKIKVMNGWYMEKTGNKIGTVNYIRITKEVFNNLKTNV